MDGAELAALAKAGEQMFVFFSLHPSIRFDERLQTRDQGSFFRSRVCAEAERWLIRVQPYTVVYGRCGLPMDIRLPPDPWG